MDKETEVRVVAGECLVDLTTAESAINNTGSVHSAITYLSRQAESPDWRKRPWF